MCADGTKYIKHYREVERKYPTPENAFKILNDKFYNNILVSVQNCRVEQSKLCMYENIYGEKIAKTSISLNTHNIIHQKLFTKYILSSHNLACETSKWRGNNKCCKQCDLFLTAMCH